MKLIYFLVVICALGIVQGEEEKAVIVKDVENVPESRIINGFKAWPSMLPWQAFILMIKPTGDIYACGGSLISDEWVITAAHCVVGYVQWKIRLGGTYSGSHLQMFAREYMSSIAIPNEGYNPSTLNNDIALIQLPRKILINFFIRPIELPSKSNAAVTFENVQLFISGFGRISDTPGISPDLKWGPARGISNAECASIFGSTVIVSSTICARGDHGESTCQGDSGGPLMYAKEDFVMLVGVTSFVSSQGCTKNFPFGFARVTSHLPWISKVTGIWLRP